MPTIESSRIVRSPSRRSLCQPRAATTSSKGRIRLTSSDSRRSRWASRDRTCRRRARRKSLSTSARGKPVSAGVAMTQAHRRARRSWARRVRRPGKAGSQTGKDHDCRARTPAAGRARPSDRPGSRLQDHRRLRRGPRHYPARVRRPPGRRRRARGLSFAAAFSARPFPARPGRARGAPPRHGRRRRAWPGRRPAESARRAAGMRRPAHQHRRRAARPPGGSSR